MNLRILRPALTCTVLLASLGCLGRTSSDPAPAVAPPIVPPLPVVVPSAPPPVAPVALPPTPVAQGPLTGPELMRAQNCAAANDNHCVIQMLAGRAQTPLERGILIDAYLASEQTDDMVREMRAFLALYPNDSRAAVYRQMLTVYAP